VDAAECKWHHLACDNLKVVLCTNITSQGLVTSAQKLNRKGLTEKYKDQIDKAYSS